VRLIATTCAVCDTGAADVEVYSATLGANSATGERFSARRMPDRVHYRMVRCRTCGLLRSNPILADNELSQLYRQSSMNYGDEAAFARATYARYLRPCLSDLPAGVSRHAVRLLEIGCGNGFFLEQALQFGFEQVRGVEPSREAVALAPPSVRDSIVNDIFRDGLFPPAHFDIICAFQVFDHLAHPNEILKTCREVLRPGGLALFINHDVGAWTNRLLGERSPVIDIEHIYLFDTNTMAKIFRKNGFEVVRVFPVENSYPLYYWMKMAPWPDSWKRKLIPAMKQTGLGRIELSWKAGNLGLLARYGGTKETAQ
jgi:SAM-dependent methyltransferase